MSFPYNQVVKTNHLDLLAPQLELLASCGYHTMNYDALWKWGMNLRIVEELGVLQDNDPDNTLFVDIGGGLSPLHFLFSQRARVINVDLIDFTRTWFPTDGKKFIRGSPGVPHCSDRIERVRADFCDYIQGMPDESVDVFYDGCSLIHIRPSQKKSYHDGITLVAREALRVLKPGGVIVSACDIAHPNFPRGLDMMPVERVGQLYIDAGLEPVSEPDYEIEPFFMDENNAHWPEHKPGLQGYRLNSPLGCSSHCEHLPLYHHLFYHQLLRKGGIKLDILHSTFTFRKP